MVFAIKFAIAAQGKDENFLSIRKTRRNNSANIFRSNGARTNAHILHAVTPTTKSTTKRPKTKQNEKFGKHQNNGPKIIAHNADEHNNKWK